MNTHHAWISCTAVHLYCSPVSVHLCCKLVLNYTNPDLSNPVVDNLNQWFTQYSCLKQGLICDSQLHPLRPSHTDQSELSIQTTCLKQGLICDSPNYTPLDLDILTNHSSKFQRWCHATLNICDILPTSRVNTRTLEKSHIKVI